MSYQQIKETLSEVAEMSHNEIWKALRDKIPQADWLWFRRTYSPDPSWVIAMKVLLDDARERGRIKGEAIRKQRQGDADLDQFDEAC